MKPSILYLDDEAQCLDVFEHAFGGEYDVRTAVSVAQARLLLSHRPAEIVISDQVMPDVVGTEFLREVAEKYPAACRILLTGGVTLGGVVGEVGAGVIHFFVTKPWDEEGMRRILERTELTLGATS